MNRLALALGAVVLSVYASEATAMANLDLALPAVTPLSSRPVAFDGDIPLAVQATSTGLPGSGRAGGSTNPCSAASACEDRSDGELPEPTSLVLMGLGLLGAATVSRRKR